MKRVITLILSLLMIFTLAACGEKEQNSPPPAEPAVPSASTSAPAPEASGKYLDTLTPPASKRALCFGAASTAGTWYVLGGGIGNAINNHSDWFTATCEASSGTGENLRNLQDGAIDFACCNSDLAYFFYSSTDTYTGAGNDQLRTFFALPVAAMHIIARADSGIESIEDIRGKRVAVGPAGSGYESFASKCIENAGMTYDDMDLIMINVNQVPEALQNNQIDVAFWPINLPGTPLVELALNTDVKFIGFDEDFINKFSSTYTGYERTIIPGGLYKGADEDIVTLGTSQCFATLADNFTEDEAYVFMCDVFDHRDEWVVSHSAAEAVTFDNIGGLIVPLHAGAVRYLEENGVTVPDALIPPEAK